MDIKDYIQNMMKRTYKIGFIWKDQKKYGIHGVNQGV